MCLWEAFSESLRTTFVDDFGVILRPILEQIWPWRDPGRVPGTTLGHLWTQNSKKCLKSTKKSFFVDLILETFFHQLFIIFHCTFKLRFGEPSEPLFKGFWCHFETISGVVFSTFWRNWKPWKMQPLPCETTVFQYPEARFFMIFPSFFQDRF